ncbi:hypothetical protein KPHS_12930 [Klebsiella pneumoniae subsp. pneumoniae HS11286]|uniref:Flagellar biosynthesis, cell-distal portion of basal-body rod n=2 Tax=Klebsiella pneumoniae complex TaxID=3390273 RepID=A0A0H3GP26_KLEPH|nr:hypothetical protein [Klebsiella pneumoniae]YP_005225593.1 hypothetical protein KPHS_12930 [Klebsiella pneumoniae subsp. pneumoniae HS11286]AEW59991.1 hypothetical protein KPHS_12930 [Klebsiella pneumoniae subsp. pneumoniae HS11286]UMX69377.1 hypothetical protein MJ560_07600 [Klebsiella pneumoniae]UMX81175.1 hypothetical protein MJ575_07845 [Klebsiella pneumoniae]
MATTDTQQTAQFAAEAAVSAAEAKQYLIEVQQGYQDISATTQEAINAATAAEAAKSAAETAEQNSSTSAAASSESATAAAGSAAQAEEYADNASDYAQNKFTFYKTASDPDGTIAGLAATTDGQSFWVAQGPDALSAAWQYQNKAGVAVLQAKQPGTSAITGTIREFPTLAAAQADADAGNIPVGSTAYYRSSDDSALAVEVINNAGTLQPTGRKMPSQNSVNQALIAAGQVATASSVRDNQLHGMSMQDRRTLAADFTQYLAVFSAGGSSALSGSGTYAERTLISIASFSTSFATAPCIMTITGAGRTLFKRGFFSGESLSDGVLTTPYFDVSMRQFTVDSVSASEVNTWVLKGSIKLPKSYSSSEGRVLRDRENSIAIGVSSSVYTYTGDTLAFDAANALLYVAVSRSAMTSAGYDDTTDGAQNYFWDTYGGLILSQQSTESQTLPEYTLFFSEAGEVSVITDQNCTATIQVTKKLSLDVGKMQSDANAVNIAANAQAYAADRLRELNLELQDYQTNIGSVGNFGSQVSYSATMNGGSIFTLNKLSLSTNVRRLVMTMTDGLGTSQSITLLEGESTAGAVLTTPYVDFVFQPLTLNTLSINTETGRSTFKIPTTLPGALPADTKRIIRDRAGYFDAYQPSTIFTGTTRGITYESATGSLIVALMNADVTAAGYALTTAGVIQYVVDKLAGYVFSQVTSVSATKTFCNIFKLAGGAVTLTTDGNATLTGTFNGPKMTTDDLTTYRRYEVVANNTTDYASGNRPVVIKCKFQAGEVPDDRCIVVTDTDGTVYPAQWAGEEDFNPRRGRNLSYWADGSLRSGDLLIIDDIPANSSKKYLLKAYPTQQDASSYRRTNRETATSLLVTADDGTEVRFDSVVGWLPYKLTRDGSNYTNICQQLYISCTGTAWSIVAANYTDYSYKIISDGPVFTEIETSFINGVISGNVPIAAGVLKHKYRTRVFKNGYVQIHSVARLQSELAENALFGCMTRMQLNTSATKSYRTEYNAIWTDNSVQRSISILNSGGDVRRDAAEISTLGNRPPVAGMTINSSYVRFDGGWVAGSTYGATTTTLGAPAGWAWPVVFAVNLNEGISDTTALSNVELNPVVGFASRDSIYPRFRQAKLMSRLGDTISGIAAWNALDATSTDNGGGMFNTIAGDIVRMLHLKIGSFETVYAKFSAWATTWYGSIGNIHLGNAADSKSLQFASRLVLPPLWWLYKLAVLNGDTEKQTELKVAIGNLAADCYSAFGTVGSANSNFYAAAFRSWAMAYAAGLDTSGSYATAMTMVDGQFSSSTYFAGVKNIITDNVTENVPKRRYLHYQMYAWNNYLIGCKAAGRASVLNMETYALNAVSGYGGLKEVDYCIAESRRGQPTTVGFMLYPLLHSGDNSCLEAAERLMDAFDEYGGSNTDGQIKLWDLDFYSVISTTFSEYTFACNIMADAWMQYWLDNNQ